MAMNKISKGLSIFYLIGIVGCSQDVISIPEKQLQDGEDVTVSFTTSVPEYKTVITRANGGVNEMYLLVFDENGNYKPLNPDYKNFGEARVNSTTCRGSMIVQNEYYDTVCGYTFDAVKLLEMQKENGKDDIMEEYDTIPRVLMTQEEIQRLAQIQPTVSDIVDRYITTWVTGGVDDASWESYKTELEGAGLSELVEIYQGAVDRAASAAN